MRNIKHGTKFGPSSSYIFEETKLPNFLVDVEARYVKIRGKIVCDETALRCKKIADDCLENFVIQLYFSMRKTTADVQMDGLVTQLAVQVYQDIQTHHLLCLLKQKAEQGVR